MRCSLPLLWRHWLLACRRWNQRSYLGLIALSVLICEHSNAVRRRDSHDRLRIKLPKFRRFLSSMLVVASGAVPRLSSSRKGIIRLYTDRCRVTWKIVEVGSRRDIGVKINCRIAGEVPRASGRYLGKAAPHRAKNLMDTGDVNSRVLLEVTSIIVVLHYRLVPTLENLRVLHAEGPPRYPVACATAR
jgi:hypothetical protein